MISSSDGFVENVIRKKMDDIKNLRVVCMPRCSGGCNYKMSKEEKDLLICEDCGRVKALREGSWKIIH